VRLSRNLIALHTVLILAGVIGATAGTQSASILRPHEPSPNLGEIKLKMYAYHDCTDPLNCYASDIEAQTDKAIQFLEQSVDAYPRQKLALVLDIDETALSNWDEIKQDDFGYISNDWDAWIDKRIGCAIPGTMSLYRDALKRGVAVFFITGRPEAQRSATSDNLKSAGFETWEKLFMRGTHPNGQLVEVFKATERQKIVDAGFRMIVNVGDQDSDLIGSPNPFYFIP